MSSLATRRFTVDELQRMADTGVIHPDERVELIEGAIVEMSPIGPAHQAQVDRLAALLLPLVTGRATVRIQGPVVLSDQTQPQPDLVLVQPRADWYAEGHPRPPDILLAMEVADTSLAYDRSVKAPLYARSGVPELWILDVASERVEVHRRPGEAGYGSVTVLAAGDTVSIQPLEGLTLEVDGLLGQV